VARILVTGGAGYVGSPLVAQLSGAGHDVSVLDDGTSGADRLARVGALARVFKADMTKIDDCRRVVGESVPEVVIHLAALHFIPECNRRPVDAVRLNVIGTQNVLDACERLPHVNRVIVTSSAAVYPPSDVHYPESHPTGPTDIYGTCKAVNEWQAEQFASRTGISTVTVRLFNVFGPGETNPHVVPEIIEQLRSGKRRLGLGNVAPKRSYVYIDDVVSGFAAIATAPFEATHTIVNLGQRDEASVADLLEMASDALGEPVEAIADPDKMRPSDRPFLRCDPTRLEMLTGWRARVNIAEGMRKLLEYEGLCPSRTSEARVGN
jgi:UDP-glucose 4-epimerase